VFAIVMWQNQFFLSVRGNNHNLISAEGSSLHFLVVVSLTNGCNSGLWAVNLYNHRGEFIKWAYKYSKFGQV
jgi:hypothetical protein